MSCRPQQWVKNLLLFAVPLGAGKLFDTDIVWATLHAMGCFCLVSGGAYLINDSQDLEYDKLHETKRLRPVASGRITAQQAIRAGVALSALGVVLTIGLPIEFTLLLTAYAILTLLYTFRLKHFAGMDIAVIATGFILRVIGGGVANDLYVSCWLLGVTGLVGLGIGASKRHSELGRSGLNQRPVLNFYTKQALQAIRLISLTGAMILYKGWLWGSRTDGIAGMGSAIMFGLWLLRFEQLTRQDKTAQPDETITRDPILVTCGVLWLTLILLEIHQVGI